MNMQKITNLIRKTGDKAIILDENGDPGFVIMSAGDYQDLVLGRSGVQGLTEHELLDKINRDIAIWKDDQELKELAIDQYNFAKDLGEYSDDNYFSQFSENIAKKASLTDDERYYFEPVNE